MPPILLAEKDQHLIVIALVISKYARLPYIWRRPFGCGKARDMERAVLAEGRLARMEKQNASFKFMFLHLLLRRASLERKIRSVIRITCFT